MAETQLKRGDIVTSTKQLNVGDVIAVVDRERLLQELPAVMARIAILRHHDTTAARQQHAGITKAGPGEPSHYHGLFNYVTPADEADGVPTDTHEVLISTESNEITIVQRGSTNPMPDLPADPLFIAAGRL